MKTYRVPGKGSLAGRAMIVQADDETDVLALFAMNWGLMNCDLDNIQEATADDVIDYQNRGGKIHKPGKSVRTQVLNILDAVDANEPEDKDFAKAEAELNAAVVAASDKEKV